MSFPSLSPKGVNKGPLYRSGWDTCVLGSYQIPGRVRVMKGGIKLKTDHKKQSGASGARPTFHGLDPQPIGLEIVVWTDEQLNQLDTVLRTLLPGGNGDSVPLSIDHAQLRHLGAIVNVQIVGASELSEGPYGPTSRKMTLELLHWMPPQGQRGTHATTTPTRAVRNVQQEDARKRQQQNAKPTQQAGVGAPPVTVSQ